ncbi:MAG TPA: ROK family protein [Candidatus Limnocylindrales bacterium]|nr:ROK family protein [Candidatus Limnocylindrales bacterium]
MRRQSVGQRSETVRRANLSSIVHELHLGGASSRSELVTRTGLTRSAIRELTRELIDAGLAREARGPSQGAPGRPSPIVRPEPRAVVALGLEIAVDSLAAALVGFGGDVLARTRIDRPRGGLSVDETVADLAGLAAPLVEALDERSRLVGVGVAVVGIVRHDDGLVASAPNLGWHDVPLAARIAEALEPRAPIYVANEADLGALAEHRRGSARDVDDVVFVSGEVGVGGGVIAGGRPLTGVAGYAGEIGHVPVNPSGATCRCGSVGCWETEIGEGALLARAGLPADGGRDAVDRLLAEAAAGDATAIGALEATGGWLGSGLAGLVNIFDPRLVILGGLFGRILPFVGSTVERRLRARALAAPRALVRVVPADLGVDAALIGAAELAFDPFLDDPAARLRPRASAARRPRAAVRFAAAPTAAATTAPAGEMRARDVQAAPRRGTMRREVPAFRVSPRVSRRAHTTREKEVRTDGTHDAPGS